MFVKRRSDTTKIISCLISYICFFSIIEDLEDLKESSNRKPDRKDVTS